MWGAEWLMADIAPRGGQRASREALRQITAAMAMILLGGAALLLAFDGIAWMLGAHVRAEMIWVAIGMAVLGMIAGISYWRLSRTRE